MRRIAVPALMLIFFFFFPLQAGEIRKIPRLFHWIHLEATPLSNEEKQAIRSWQIAHPQWTFNIWTNGPCALNKTITRSIDPKIRDVESLKREILQREGGVWVHPDLIGCKSLDPLTFAFERFATSDGSVLGSAPGSFDQTADILPSNFVSPNQIFKPDIFSSTPLSSVCFWQFRKFPALTEEFRKIQEGKAERDFIYRSLNKKLTRSTKICIGLIVLILINTWLGYFLFSQIDRRQLKRFLIYAAPILGFLGLCAALIPLAIQKSTPHASSIFYWSEKSQKKTLSLEDLSDIHTYNESFLKSEHLLTAPSGGEPKIPRVIHFIWGGENAFPQKSVDNIRSWITRHPGWVFKFWTDRSSRSLPVSEMQQHLFSELELPYIGSCFADSKNWGEKSDLLRYEILYREGGIYVDHDVECFRSFAPLCDNFSLFTFLEPFHPSPVFGNCVILSNCLIGAQAGHPILMKTMRTINERWQEVSEILPCDDKISSLLRTLANTFDSFNTTVKESIQTQDLLVLPGPMLFPTHYPKSWIGALPPEKSPFANHQWNNTWFKDIPETSCYEISESIKNKINSISKKTFKLLKLNFLIFGCLSLASLWSFLIRRSQSPRKA